MNTAWKKVKIEDIIDSFFDGPHATPKESDSGGIFLGIKNLTDDGRLDFSNINYISNEDLPKWTKRVIPQEGDLVFSYEATLHRYAIIPKNFHGCLGRRIALIRVNKNIANNKFLLYYFLSPKWRKEVESKILNGATVDRLPLSTFPKFNLAIPPLETQTQIANILSAYDDLIKNNLRRIKLLEEMAEVYFLNEYLKNENVTKERVKLNTLVSFEIGGGWGEEEQNQEFNSPAFVIRGTDINNITTGKIENIPFRFHKKSNLSSRKLQHGDIIFEVSGGSQTEGVGKTILITNDLLKQFNSDIMCASFCKLLRPSKIDYSYFLNLLLKYFRKCKLTEVYEIRSASNIVNYNWSAFLKNQDILLPSDDFLGNFNNFIAPINTQILNLSHQNRLLKESRDILLPRLMSGEVGV